MHPAYLDLQDYVDAADDRELRAARTAARASELLDEVLAELAAALPTTPVQVLRLGTAGDHQQPILVADLGINGTEVKARSDGTALRLWVSGTELSMSQLAARLGPVRRRRLFRGWNPSVRSGPGATTVRMRPTSTS